VTGPPGEPFRPAGGHTYRFGSRVLHTAVTRQQTFLSETSYRSIAAWMRLPDDLFQMLFLLQSIDLDPGKIAP
jgi:hypothetical protein